MRDFVGALVFAVVMAAVVACTAVPSAPAIESSAAAAPREVLPEEPTYDAKPSPTAEPSPSATPPTVEAFETATAIATETEEPSAPTARPDSTSTPVPGVVIATPIPAATATNEPEATPEPYRSPVPTYSPEASTGVHGGTDGSNTGVEIGRIGQGCESDPSPVLTSHITDLSAISAIQPPSVISGNWYKNRSYLNIAAEYGSQAPSIPVYAPADAEMTGITYYLQPMSDVNGNWLDVPQYEVRLQLSCEVTYGFDHLSELALGIAEHAPAEPSTSTRDAEKSVSIEVKAGDMLGYTTGTIVAHSWDFIYSNSGVVNRFANQERYENTGDLNVLFHAECPYNYFEGDMGDEYRALFGVSGGDASNAGCDTSYDIPGGIYGGWFKTPFDGDVQFAKADWGMAIALMPDGSIRVNGENSSVRLGPKDNTYLDPRIVTDEHCYASARGTGGQEGWHVFLKMLSADTIGVAFDQGSCPKSLPGDHIVYYR